jgi:hypothetical protein
MAVVAFEIVKEDGEISIGKMSYVASVVARPSVVSRSVVVVSDLVVLIREFSVAEITSGGVFEA